MFATRHFALPILAGLILGCVALPPAPALAVGPGACGDCGGYHSGADIRGFNPSYRGYHENTRLDRYSSAAFRPRWYFGGPRYPFVSSDYHCHQIRRAYYGDPYRYGYGGFGFDGGCGYGGYDDYLPRARYCPPYSRSGYSFHALDRYITGPSYWDVWEASRKDAVRYELFREAYPPDFVHEREQERRHIEFTQELMKDEGWELLEKGEGRKAITHFARLATRHRGNGLPKVGFALACALEGDDNVAAASMRHALQTDPDALNQFVADPKLRERMAAMIERYGGQEELSYRRGDALIMAASLHYLLGQFEESTDAIARALENGDKFQTTLGLQQLASRATEHQNALAMNATMETSPVRDLPNQKAGESRSDKPRIVTADFAWFEAD